MADYSFSLIPSDELSQKIRYLSESLGFEFGLFQPHITLLSFETPVDVAVESLEVEATISGYYCDIDDKARVWHGLKMNKTSKLLELRQQLSEEYGLMSTQDNDDYFPHITLGCTSISQLSNIALSPLEGLLQLNGTHVWHLRRCRHGELGKVVEVLS